MCMCSICVCIYIPEDSSSSSSIGVRGNAPFRHVNLFAARCDLDSPRARERASNRESTYTPVYMVVGTCVELCKRVYASNRGEISRRA